MNDKILCGFCKKCEYPIEMDWLSPTVCEPSHGEENDMAHSPEPVWFLNANQMSIIYESESFSKWFDSQNYGNGVWALIKFLQDEPFLIAKILKESEGK